MDMLSKWSIKFGNFAKQINREITVVIRGVIIECVPFIVIFLKLHFLSSEIETVSSEYNRY